MATWTDPEKRVWNYSSEKLDFDAWLEDAPGRFDAWIAACDEHRIWQEANPGAPSHESTAASGKIFQDWVEYSSAYWDPDAQ